jgi:probable addiction module antidote protein
MPKRTGDFNAWLLNELTDPEIAASYVSAAIREDQDVLPVVLREVAKAYTMKRVAEEAGIARESLYTCLSETGNPTLLNLNRILKAVGLKFDVIPDHVKPSGENPGLGPTIKTEVTATNDANVAEGKRVAPVLVLKIPQAANLTGVNASAGVVSFGIGIQSAPGSEISPLLHQARQLRCEVIEIAKATILPPEPYLKQLARAAGGGAN